MKTKKVDIHTLAAIFTIVGGVLMAIKIVWPFFIQIVVNEVLMYI